MTTGTIKTAMASDEAPIVDVIVLAFSTDPAARYHPSEPHWYLPLIGVDPSQQGKGYGSALLTHALMPCNRDHTCAYLESSNPKNIPLYERHGFEVLGTIQVGTSPPIFPMLRKPR
jgi:ribosomal protein S18 acetylase RimI-like enzyme